jgi:uncharacterized protein
MDNEPDTRTHSLPRCIAFMGARRIAEGRLDEVAVQVQAAARQGQTSPILVFDAATSRVIDLDLRGTPDSVRRHAAQLFPPVPAGDGNGEGAEARRGPGRPRLGVVAREVTLLPRHWEWLNDQPGGASAALRRLVDHARRASAGHDVVRKAQEAAYRFMSAMAGDEPGFEEATRALFSGNAGSFDALVAGWPPDVRDHARVLAAAAFTAERAAAPANAGETDRD